MLRKLNALEVIGFQVSRVTIVCIVCCNNQADNL